MTKQARIIEAIAECTRFINREEARNSALRPAEIQKLLEWYKSHRASLTGMLEA